MRLRPWYLTLPGSFGGRSSSSSTISSMCTPAARAYWREFPKVVRSCLIRTSKSLCSRFDLRLPVFEASQVETNRAQFLSVEAFGQSVLAEDECCPSGIPSRWQSTSWKTVDYMDSYPYSVAAFLIRRELEPSMLNGDAHHSTSWEFELRIWPLSIYQRLDRRRA